MNGDRQDNRIIWLNGALVNVNDAKINALSPTAQFGLNVFEGIRCYWNEARQTLFAFRLDDHLKRLQTSAELLEIDHPYSLEDLRQAFRAPIAANGYREDIAVRMMLFVDGFGTWSSHGPAGMFVSPIAKQRLSAEYRKDGLRCKISTVERIHEKSMSPLIKCGANYINSRMAMLEAQKEGFDTAVLLNRRGTVAEATGSCIFIVKDGKLATPALSDSILNSVTRDTVIRMANAMCIPLEERSVQPEELFRCDEAFLCGTAMEIKSVESFDGRRVENRSGGNVTRLLQKEYARGVLGEGPQEWVTAL
jgi:branched-chain amino acid aminotransferase